MKLSEMMKDLCNAIEAHDYMDQDIIGACFVVFLGKHNTVGQKKAVYMEGDYAYINMGLDEAKAEVMRRIKG